jgi:hypothetical protein
MAMELNLAEAASMRVSVHLRRAVAKFFFLSHQQAP